MHFESKFYIGEKVKDLITGYVGVITSVTFKPGNENLYMIDNLDANHELHSVPLEESRLVSYKSNNNFDDNKNNNDVSFKKDKNICGFIRSMANKECNGESVPSPELIMVAIRKTINNEPLNSTEEKALKIINDFFGFKH